VVGGGRIGERILKKGEDPTAANEFRETAKEHAGIVGKRNMGGLQHEAHRPKRRVRVGAS